MQQFAANLAQKMTECENDLAMTGPISHQQEANETIAPIILMAQIARKEAEETKILSR